MPRTRWSVTTWLRFCCVAMISRAQFYIRRLNNGDLRTPDRPRFGHQGQERALGDVVAMRQLAAQLRKRFRIPGVECIRTRGFQ